MLKPADAQDFKSNTDYYFNIFMETVQDSPPDLKPKQGKLTINDKTVNLYLYQNPWIYHHSSKPQNPAPINSIFHYCVVCGIDNYEDGDFKNLANLNVNINQLNLMNCDKIECQMAVVELLKDEYRGLVDALLEKNAAQLKQYADASGDTL